MSNADKPVATYRNPWHNPHNPEYGPAVYETTARPVSGPNDTLIYERIPGKVWDVVRDGVCLTQRAGLRGAHEGAMVHPR